MRKNKEKIKFNKIDVDDATLEPTIVEISEKDYQKQTATPNSESNPANPEQPPVTIPDHGQQMVMKKVFGVKDDDRSVDRRQRIFKLCITAIFFAFIGGVLVYTFLNDFIFAEKELPSGTDLIAIFNGTWFYILPALLSLFLYYFCKGLKLSILCRSLTKKWHFKTCMETAIVGIYYNNVTPLAVGGQPFEIYHLSKHGVHGGVAASLPIATYFLGQVSFVFLSLAAVICYMFNVFNIPEGLTNNLPPTITALAFTGLFFCLLLPVIVVIFCIFPSLCSNIVKRVMKIGGKLRIVKDPEKATEKTIANVQHNAKCLRHIATTPLAFIANVLLSLCEHLALSSIAYFTLRFFGFNLPGVNWIIEWLQIVQVCLILYSAISFIPTPGNSGAADLSFYILFSFGISFAGGAFCAMMVWRVLSFYSTLIIGFTFTNLKKRADKRRMLIEQVAITDNQEDKE